MSTDHVVLLIIGILIVAGILWALWRVAVWCLFWVSIISLWLLQFPAVFYIPLMVILAVIAWPIAILALFGWLLMALFPGLIPPDDIDDPYWKPLLRKRHDTNNPQIERPRGRGVNPPWLPILFRLPPPRCSAGCAPPKTFIPLDIFIKYEYPKL